MKREEFLEALGFDKAYNRPCETCGGIGRRAYSSTATWRGGVGGQAITTDVCDKCWGSGAEHHKGADLRALYTELKRLKKKCGEE